MIHPVVAFYAACCAATLWFAHKSPPEERLPAFLATVVLTIGCLLSNIAWFTDAIGNWKRIDGGVMLALFGLAWWHHRRWTIVLLTLAVGTMGVHAAVEWSGDQSEAMLYAYPAALNAIFVLQLLTVGSNGARGARENGSNGLAFTWPRLPGRGSRRLRGSADRTE